MAPWDRSCLRQSWGTADFESITTELTVCETDPWCFLLAGASPSFSPGMEKPLTHPCFGSYPSCPCRTLSRVLPSSISAHRVLVHSTPLFRSRYLFYTIFYLLILPYGETSPCPASRAEEAEQRSCESGLTLNKAVPGERQEEKVQQPLLAGASSCVCFPGRAGMAAPAFCNLHLCFWSGVSSGVNGCEHPSL